MPSSISFIMFSSQPNLLCLPTGFKYPQNTVIHTCFLGKIILIVDRCGKSLYGEHYSRAPVITFFDLRS